jgi:hypothetical protein
MRYEGAASLMLDEADLRRLKPGDKLGHQMGAFVKQLPEDRRRMIYIADSFQGPPMFSAPRIKMCNDHALNRSEETWINFNDRAWMVTTEVRGVRPTELYEPSGRGTESRIELFFEPDSTAFTLPIRSSWSAMDARLKIERLKGTPHHEQEMIVEWYSQDEID